jgi:hypothetical protein
MPEKAALQTIVAPLVKWNRCKHGKTFIDPPEKTNVPMFEGKCPRV